MHVAKKEKVLLTKKELLEEIIILTGGRASEEIEFDSVTTGASNDIERATEMARNIITTYGMSDTFGFVQLAKEKQHVSCRYEDDELLGRHLCKN